MKNFSGIYYIKNKINNKMYIGRAVNINQRICKHKSDLRKNQRENKYFQNAYNKYGKENFDFGIILILPNNKHLLNTFEIFFIWLYNTKIPNGYNFEKGGGGYEHTKEHIENLKNSFSKKPRKIKPPLKRKQYNSKSKYYGLSWSEFHNYWRVLITINKKQKWIANFKNEMDAAQYYDKYVIENNLPNPLNFPNE